MVDLDDYLEGGERHGLPLEDDEPGAEVTPALSIGDRVIIDVCPCFEQYNGTVATIAEINGNPSAEHPYRGPIDAHGGSSLWFSASRLADDEDTKDEDEDDGRPTTGDVVIVHELDEGHITLPQILEIKRDDHDSAPYYGEFLTDDGDDDSLEGCYFTEQQCTIYVTSKIGLPRYAEGAEVPEGTKVIVEYDEGQLVRVTESTDQTDLVGQTGRIVKVDTRDKNLSYYVRFEDDNLWWVNEVEPVDEGEIWLKKREQLWDEFAEARRALLDHLGEGRQRPSLATMAEILAIKHQVQPRSRVLRAVKDLRFWARNKEGISLGLREAKDLIETAYRNMEEA